MFLRFRLVLLTAVLLLPIGAEVVVDGRSQPVVAQSVDSRKAEGEALREATRLYKQGEDQLNQGQLPAALELLQKALQMYRSIDRRSQTGRTYTEIDWRRLLQPERLPQND